MKPRPAKGSQWSPNDKTFFPNLQLSYDSVERFAKQESQQAVEARGVPAGFGSRNTMLNEYFLHLTVIFQAQVHRMGATSSQAKHTVILGADNFTGKVKLRSIGMKSLTGPCLDTG